jgi:hypothetical protein
VSADNLFVKTGQIQGNGQLEAWEGLPIEAQ